MEPVFQDEVMLAGWGETHSGGAKVTFWLKDSEALEAFKRMTVAKGKTAGQRLACVLVEIDDDEQPKVPTKADEEMYRAEPSQQLTGLALLAVQWCKTPSFRSFLGVETEEEAKQSVINTCCIQSRKELMNNPQAQDKFLKFIRQPYMQHAWPLD